MSRARRHPLSPLLLGLLLGLAATAWSAPAPAAPEASVFVSILPQAWFVERLGGDLVAVEVLVGPGHSPATYEPTPRQMARLTGADLFLGAGVPFERALLPRLRSLPGMPPLAGPRPDPAPAGDPHGHGHGDGLDPHSWLSPEGAAALADTVTAALLRLLPEHRRILTERRAALQRDLDATAADVRTRLAGCRGAAFFVFHPAYGHFARAYGLRQVAFEEDGHEPGARRLAEVIDLARANGARAVVVQPQFSKRSAAAVARAVGVPLVELDPLAADYLANLQHMAAVLAGILAPPTAARETP